MVGGHVVGCEVQRWFVSLPVPLLNSPRCWLVLMGVVDALVRSMLHALTDRQCMMRKRCDVEHWSSERGDGRIARPGIQG